MEGWVLTLIGVIVGLAGLVAALLFYRLSRVGPRLVYQIRVLELIGKVKPALPEEVEIRYRNRSVTRLMRVHIILWNSGRATLDGEKIVQDDKLRFEFGKEVLRVHTLRETKRVNEFTAEVNPDYPNQVIFNFAYFDPGDGVTIEILHTDEKGYPKVQGSIRGLPKGILNWGTIVFPRLSLATKWFVGGLMSFLLAMGILTFLPVIRREPSYLNLTVGLVVLGMWGYGVWAVWRRFSERFPKSLGLED